MISPGLFVVPRYALLDYLYLHPIDIDERFAAAAVMSTTAFALGKAKDEIALLTQRGQLLQGNPGKRFAALVAALDTADQDVVAAGLGES